MKTTEKAKFMNKKLGKPMEAEEENESEDSYEMPREQAITEHQRLIKVLRTGTKAEQMKEADLQEAELKKIIDDNEEEED